MKFNESQIDFIKSIGLKLDFENMTDDNLVEIENKVALTLQKLGFDENYQVTDVGRMCESILDQLA